MKRDFSFKKSSALSQVLKWLLSFVISILVLFIGLILLTVIQKQYRFSDNIVKIVVFVLITLSSGFCAFVFRKMTKIKGMLCGLVTAGVFCVIKLIMSLVSGGVGANNFLIYSCIISASLLGGILSANHRKKEKW